LSYYYACRRGRRGGPDVLRHRPGVGDFSATVDYIRRYYDENPAA
jgi:hypothetical protein